MPQGGAILCSADLAGLGLGTSSSIPPMPQRNTADCATNRAGLGLGACSIIPLVPQGHTAGFATDGAGLGLRAGRIFPAVPQGHTAGFATRGAGLRLGAVCIRPAMAQGAALSGAAAGTGLGIGASGRVPLMPQRRAAGFAADGASLGLGAGGIVPVVSHNRLCRIGIFVNIGRAGAAADLILVDNRIAQNGIFIHANGLSKVLAQKIRHLAGGKLRLRLGDAGTIVGCGAGQIIAVSHRSIRIAAHNGAAGFSANAGETEAILNFTTIVSNDSSHKVAAVNIADIVAIGDGAAIIGNHTGRIIAIHITGIAAIVDDAVIFVYHATGIIIADRTHVAAIFDGAKVTARKTAHHIVTGNIAGHIGVRNGQILDHTLCPHIAKQTQEVRSVHRGIINVQSEDRHLVSIENAVIIIAGKADGGPDPEITAIAV